MKKAIILYSSIHHGNTKKLLDAVKSSNEVMLQEISQIESINLADYDLIGFASGIYMGKMHQTIMEFIEKHSMELSKKKVFLMATCGGSAEKGLQDMAENLKRCQAEVLGTFQAYGYDTFGPFKLIGGIRKKHPDEKECERAQRFVEGLVVGK